MAGSSGERAALEATRDALAEAGAADAHVEQFDIQGWTRGTSAIDAGSTAYDCIALPRSPSDEVTAELVDLGYGLPADFEERDVSGAIVVVASDVPDWYDRRLHRREKYYLAVEHGAAGFVYRNDAAGQLPPTGSVGRDDQPIGEVPAVGVSKEVGTTLCRRFAGEEVTLQVEATTEDATSGIVRAAVGPETDRRVLVTSHVDAHDIAEGAIDNGAGTAAVVEIAGALADRADALATRVEFVCFGAEEVGLQGSSYYADAVAPDEIKAVVNVDGICRGRTLAIATHHFDPLAAAVDRVAERFDHPITTSPKLNPHSDHWSFVAQGIPGLLVGSASDTSGRGWTHTHADTLDKVDVRDLRDAAILLTDVVIEIADDGLDCPHKATSAIADALEAEGYADGMKRTGDWPY